MNYFLGMLVALVLVSNSSAFAVSTSTLYARDYSAEISDSQVRDASTVFRNAQSCKVLLGKIFPKSSPFESLALQLAVGFALNRQGDNAATWLNDKEIAAVSEAYHLQDDQDVRKVLQSAWSDIDEIAKITKALKNRPQVDELMNRIFWSQPTREDVQAWRRGDM